MNFKIELSPSGRTFECAANETILDAALRQQLILPYGCKDGACGTCRSTVLQGEWQQQANTALNNQVDAQAILICKAYAQSDMVIAANPLSGLNDIPVRKLPVRISAIDRPEESVAVVRLQLPATEKFLFKPGQYIDLLLRDNQRRSFSIANAPHEGNELVLHIRFNHNGFISQMLFPERHESTTSKPLAVRDILRFEGPLGTFFLSDSPAEQPNQPMILLASGTGYAPIRAIIADALERKLERPMHLYWGGRRPHELYAFEECQRWQELIPDFQFTPVISAALDQDQWYGKEGLVHQAVMADYPDLSQHQVYACGAPVMVNAARSDFQSLCGLHENAFFADSFEAAPPSTTTTPRN